MHHLYFMVNGLKLCIRTTKLLGLNCQGINAASSLTEVTVAHPDRSLLHIFVTMFVYLCNIKMPLLRFILLIINQNLFLSFRNFVAISHARFIKIVRRVGGVIHQLVYSQTVV